MHWERSKMVEELDVGWVSTNGPTGEHSLKCYWVIQWSWAYCLARYESLEAWRPGSDCGLVIEAGTQKPNLLVLEPAKNYGMDVTPGCMNNSKELKSKWLGMYLWVLVFLPLGVPWNLVRGQSKLGWLQISSEPLMRCSLCNLSLPPSFLCSSVALDQEDSVEYPWSTLCEACAPVVPPGQHWSSAAVRGDLLNLHLPSWDGETETQPHNPLHHQSWQNWCGPLAACIFFVCERSGTLLSTWCFFLPWFHEYIDWKGRVKNFTQPWVLPQKFCPIYTCQTCRCYLSTIIVNVSMLYSTPLNWWGLSPILRISHCHFFCVMISFGITLVPGSEILSTSISFFQV